MRLVLIVLALLAFSTLLGCERDVRQYAKTEIGLYQDKVCTDGFTRSYKWYWIKGADGNLLRCFGNVKLSREEYTNYEDIWR